MVLKRNAIIPPSPLLILERFCLDVKNGIHTGIFVGWILNWEKALESHFSPHFKKKHTQLPLLGLKIFVSALGHTQLPGPFKVLEGLNPLGAGFSESIQDSLSMLCGEAVPYGFFCFLDTFLEPAAISGKLFPGSFPILLAADVILSNFFKEGYLEKTNR